MIAPTVAPRAHRGDRGRLHRSADRGGLCRRRLRRHVCRHQRRENRATRRRARRPARARPARSRPPRPSHQASAVRDRRGGRGARRIDRFRVRADPASARRLGRPLVCGARRSRRGRRGAARHDSRHAIDGARRHRRATARDHRASRRARGGEPGVLARRQRGERLLPPRPHSHRRHRGRRASSPRRVVRRVRRAGDRHRHSDGRTHQACGQRLSRHAAEFREFDGQHLRIGRRRRAPDDEGDRPRPAHRPEVPLCGPGLGRFVPAQRHPRARARRAPTRRALRAVGEHGGEQRAPVRPRRATTR